ncbi:unnamed protein product [Arctia plantaginis]|uniref:Serpin domain-containing protein n=1 Tax=Arctia plantaginis TaxID=874455 RepID=A0A8S1A645_ARCPL|nr:unnamed protein product [Arctia plantaginis]
MKIYLFILALVASTVISETDVKDVLKNGNVVNTTFFDFDCTNGVVVLALALTTEISKERADQSFVISAFSVLSPLAQLALASVGHSHDEILTAIGMPNDNMTKEVFADLNTRIRSINSVELKQANKIYVRNGNNLNKEFAAVSRTVFNSEVQNINFVNSQEAADEINTWVEANTNKRIKDLVNPTSLSADTAVVLVNAIFFKGNWQSPFATYSTHERDFLLSKSQNVTVQMMYQLAMFKYADNEDLDAKLLEMPYEGGETSFVVVLPKQNDGIESLIEKLKDPAALPKALSTMHTVDVQVYLPKFKIETSTNLKQVLQKININQLFVEGQAHLDNLIEGASNLYVSDAVQKAFMQVDETGTEAAAANAFGVGAAFVIDPHNYESFDADHPFVFYLMHHNNILFNGVFRS